MYVNFIHAKQGILVLLNCFVHVLLALKQFYFCRLPTLSSKNSVCFKHGCIKCVIQKQDVWLESLYCEENVFGVMVFLVTQSCVKGCN